MFIDTDRKSNRTWIT